MRTYGTLHRLLADDHRRLDALLEQTRRDLEKHTLTVYDEFRRELLRHISIEEKVLLPAIQRLRGSALPIASRLRLDHGAIAALLVPPPSRGIVQALLDILTRHDALEEGPGGFYDAIDELAGPETERLAAEIQSARAVPLSPNINNPHALDATRRALARAGYDFDKY